MGQLPLSKRCAAMFRALWPPLRRGWMRLPVTFRVLKLMVVYTLPLFTQAALMEMDAYSQAAE